MLKLPTSGQEANGRANNGIIQAKIFLLVEGKDEVNFFTSFFNKNENLNHMNLNNYIQIEEGSGAQKFPSIIKALPQRTGFEVVETLLVVRDGDGKEGSMFESICSNLNSIDMPVPANINTFSETISGVNTGIFIMPGKIEGVMLEDLCLKIPNKKEIVSYIDDYMSKIIEDEIIETPKNIAKAKVQIFLASQKIIVKDIGLGAQKNYFDLNNALLGELVSFFQTIEVD